MMNFITLTLFQTTLILNNILAKGRDAGRTPTPNGTGDSYKLPNPLGVQTITDLIDRIAGYLFVIATPIVTLMILFAAFQILTAGDNPEKLKTAKQIILWTCVGYGIILISKGITLIIKQLLGG